MRRALFCLIRKRMRNSCSLQSRYGSIWTRLSTSLQLRSKITSRPRLRSFGICASLYRKSLTPTKLHPLLIKTTRRATWLNSSILRRQSAYCPSSWMDRTTRQRFTHVKHCWNTMIWTNMGTSMNKETQRICSECSGFTFRTSSNTRSTATPCLRKASRTNQPKNNKPT